MRPYTKAPPARKPQYFMGIVKKVSKAHWDKSEAKKNREVRAKEGGGGAGAGAGKEGAGNAGGGKRGGGGKQPADGATGGGDSD